MNFSDDDLEILKKQSLLTGLDEAELIKLTSLFEKKEFETNDVIIEEEEESSTLFLIVEGDVNVLKLDEEKLFNMPIGRLSAGDMFGEMSFMDKSPRSSSIEASKKTVVYELSRDAIEEKLPEFQSIYNKIISNISIININRLRASNTTQVKTLRTSLRGFQLRQQWGYFLFVLLFAAGFLNAFAYLIHPYININLFNTTYWFAYLIATIIIIKYFHYYFDNFGIKTENLFSTIKESIIILCLITPFIYIASYLFAPITSSPLNIQWIIYYLIYCLCFEFIGRGVFLLSIKRFLEDNLEKTSNILTACFLTFIPITSYFLPGNIFWFFLFNLSLNFLFLRHENLVGVSLIHIVVGLLAKSLHLI